ncbi:MAG: hypothetical protein WCX61_03140 [Candidatus Peribacteraceae bacterium]
MSEKVPKRAIEQGQTWFKDLDEVAHQRLKDLEYSLKRIRIFCEVNPTLPKREEKIKYLEEYIQRLDSAKLNLLTININKLDVIARMWEERMKTLKADESPGIPESPRGKEFLTVCTMQAIEPVTTDTIPGYTKKQYVDWGLSAAKVAPLDQPLYTIGMNGCAGLIIIDRKKNLQYLAHVTPTEFERDRKEEDIMKIRNDLVTHGFDVQNAEFVIVEGNSKGFFTPYKIFDAIRILGGGMSQVSFVPSSGSNGRYGENIICMNGHPRRASDTLQHTLVLDHNLRVCEYRLGIIGEKRDPFDYSCTPELRLARVKRGRALMASLYKIVERNQDHLFDRAREEFRTFCATNPSPEARKERAAQLIYNIVRQLRVMILCDPTVRRYRPDQMKGGGPSLEYNDLSEEQRSIDYAYIEDVLMYQYCFKEEQKLYSSPAR